MSALSDDTQRTFQALAHEFSVGWLAPVMAGPFAGAPAKATRPLPPHALDLFALSRPTDASADQACYEAFHRLAAEVAPVGTLPYPDRGTWALAMAAHNLTTLTDPLQDAAFRRSSRPVVADWAARLIDAAGDPSTRGEALMRYALVRRVLELQREDRVIKNWAYTYRFWGRRAPANVTAWPTLRFVREQVSPQPLDDYWFGDRPETLSLGLDRLMGELLARSPLTSLLRLRDTPGFRFDGGMLAVLSDPELRHGVSHQLVRGGLGTTSSRVGEALRELSALGAGSHLLGSATAFVLETVMMAALDRGAAESPPRLDDQNARLFWAVLPEALGAHDALDPLEVVPPSDRRRLGEWAIAIASELDDDTRNLARALFQRVAFPGPAGPDARSLS